MAALQRAVGPSVAIGQKSQCVPPSFGSFYRHGGRRNLLDQAMIKSSARLVRPTHLGDVLLRERREILELVRGWAGSEARALAWYRAQPISALGGRTAEVLVGGGQAYAVRQYIDHVALGGFA